MWKSGFTTYFSKWKLSSNGKSQLVTRMNPSNEPILKWFLRFSSNLFRYNFSSISNHLSLFSIFTLSCPQMIYRIVVPSKVVLLFKSFVKTIFSITSLSILSSTRIDFDQFSSSSPPMRLRLYWISHHFPDWIGVWVKLKLLLLCFSSVAILFCKRRKTNVTFLNYF